MYRKGQTLSYDFLIASSLFIVVLSIVLSYWTYSSKQIDDSVTQNDLANKLFLSTQVWFQDGYPQYWNPSNVAEIGLTNNGYLNTTKVNSLNTVGYGNVLELVGLQGYNLYYRVFGTSNNTEFQFGNYPSNASTISRFDRISVLNGTLVTIETLVWR